MKQTRDKGWLPDGIFNTVINSVPVVAVNCMIVKDYRILLTKRSIPPSVGYWHLPGGLLRKGENLLDCARRKALDETGLKVRIERLVGVFSDPATNPRRHDVNISFLCRIKEGEPRGSWQAEQVGFFSLRKLPKEVGFDVAQEVRELRKTLKSSKRV